MIKKKYQQTLIPLFKAIEVKACLNQTTIPLHPKYKREEVKSFVYRD